MTTQNTLENTGDRYCFTSPTSWAAETFKSANLILNFIISDRRINEMHSGTSGSVGKEME